MHALKSDLATISVAIPTPDMSMISVLLTAIPPSLLASITEPAVAASLQSDFQAGNTPAWYSDLPDDVKSFVNSAGGVAETNAPLSSVASSLTAGASSVASSLSAGASSVASSLSSQLSSATASAASAASAGSSSSSTGGAPAPTGAIVASMAGIVGVLALAVGL